MTHKDERVPGFNLHNSSEDFNSKTKDIFGSLDALESKHATYESRRNKEDTCSGWKTDPTSDDTETIMPAFKKPQGLPSRNTKHSYSDGRSKGQRGGGSDHGHNGEIGQERNRHDQGRKGDRWNNRGCNEDRRRMGQWQDRHYSEGRGRRGGYGVKRKFTPDHVLHPEKYTKYSLEDVEEMSNASNSQAALAFLEERRKLREGEVKAEAVDTAAAACSKGLFVFSKKSKNINVSVKSKTTEAYKVDSLDDTSSTENDTDTSECNNDDFNVSDEKLVFKSRKKNLGKRNIRKRETSGSDSD